jgi:hypothetical protein
MTHAKERPVRMSFENLDSVDQGGSFSSPARRSAWLRQYRPNGWDIVVPFLIHICDVPACLDEIRSSEDKIQRISRKDGLIGMGVMAELCA